MPITGATGYDAVTGASAPGSALTDFTLYVAFEPSASWWSAYNAHGDSGRIRVTTALGTELPRDVLVAPTSSLVVLRVLWAGAQSAAPVVYVYPDATGAYVATDTYGQHAAYNSGWAALWTFDGDPASGLLDRTGNGNHGTPAGLDSGDVSAAKLASGWSFDGGVDHYVDLPDAIRDALSATADWSVWCWVKFASLAADQWILSSALGSSDRTGIGLRADIGHLFGSRHTGSYDRKSIALADTSNFHSVAVVNDSGVSLVMDGYGSTDTNGVSINTVAKARMGMRQDGATASLSATVDDFQVHSVARSAAWFSYERVITSDAASFWSSSGWTALGGGSASRLLMLRRRAVL